MHRLLIALSLIVAWTGLAEAQKKSADLAITNVEIRSPEGTRSGQNIVVRNGKIASIGTQRVPAGMQSIDGTGMIATAGLIATATRLGLQEISAVSHAREGSFAAGGVHAAYRVTDGYNADSFLIDVARNGGITSTLTQPTGGLIAGQSAWMSLAEGEREDLIIKNGVAMHVTLGRRAKSSGKGSRGRAVQRLRELFVDARHLSKNRAAFDRGQTRKYSAAYLDLLALLPVLRGEVPLVVEVDRKSDIDVLLSLAKEFSLRIAIIGGKESHLIAGKLAKARVPVIINPKDNIPSSFDELYVVDDLATRLHKAGVPVIISSFGSTSTRALRQQAGLAVAHGLPWEAALASITSVPANFFGVQRGTLKVGAAADLVLWTGDPLELSSRAHSIIVGGTVQSQDNHQTKLLDRYR